MMCKTVSLGLAAVLVLAPSVYAGTRGGSKKMKSMYFSELMDEGEEVQLSYTWEEPTPTLQSMYFSKMMAEGEEALLLYHGPFTISAVCSDTDVRLTMMVEAEEEEEWVYGFPDYLPQDYYNSCVGTTPAETTSDPCIVWSAGSGTSHIAGAYTSLSGYYVGFGGSSTIGFNKAYLTDDRTYHNGFTADDVDKFPTGCAVSGELTYNSV